MIRPVCVSISQVQRTQSLWTVLDNQVTELRMLQPTLWNKSFIHIKGINQAYVAKDV